MSDQQKTSITKEDIDAIIRSCEINHFKVGEKTTLVQLVMPTGFTLTESSSCVDPANYDHDMGVNLAMKKVEDKIWFLEGYVLQNVLAGRFQDLVHSS
jgi:hypothetical protein